MKNPNGYGSVVKLSGNRRNPYWVRKTVGWNEKGHPKYETIGYFPTREEGMMKLAEYNRNPWDIDGHKMTFQDVYESWLEKKGSKLGKASQTSLRTAYKWTEPIRDMKYKEIKSFHMQECIDRCDKSASLKNGIKNLFTHIDKYALEVDIVEKTYSQLLKSTAIEESDKEPFSEDEIKLLWEHQNDPWVDTVIIFLYTGFRISELLTLKREDVNLEERTMTGGTKTKAGKGRIVPIHSRIFPLIERRYDDGNEYLISHKDKKVSIENYRVQWKQMMENFQMKHTPHECRHTFRSRLDSANANKKCIDLMMGHKSSDVGQRVYTHKTIEELFEAIEKLN